MSLFGARGRNRAVRRFVAQHLDLPGSGLYPYIFCIRSELYLL
jgi:hypothetical protein